MRHSKGNFLVVLMTFAVSGLLLGWGTTAEAQKTRAALGNPAAPIQQPLYNEYKGVSLGMAAQEVRTKLGEPTMKDSELDYFMFSDTESAQFGYDAAGKVKVISVDYQNGIGAPAPAAVVGTDLEPRPNGTLYKIVRYDQRKLWVSYSRSTSAPIIVTVTIQKM